MSLCLFVSLSLCLSVSLSLCLSVSVSLCLTHMLWFFDSSSLNQTSHARPPASSASKTASTATTKRRLSHTSMSYYMHLTGFGSTSVPPRPVAAPAAAPVAPLDMKDFRPVSSASKASTRASVGGWSQLHASNHLTLPVTSSSRPVSQAAPKPAARRGSLSELPKHKQVPVVETPRAVAGKTFVKQPAISSKPIVKSTSGSKASAARPSDATQVVKSSTAASNTTQTIKANNKGGSKPAALGETQTRSTRSSSSWCFL
jgi:hypothetical protein